MRDRTYSKKHLYDDELENKTTELSQHSSFSDSLFSNHPSYPVQMKEGDNNEQSELAQNDTTVNNKAEEDAERKKKALALIAEFETKTGIRKVAWTQISSSDFARDLRVMINDPRTIAQKSTNLCGIAVTCKAMIEYDPENFVKMAISLYENAEADSIHWYTTGASANEDLLNEKPSKDLNSATYVILTSLRHTYNRGVAYDPLTDTGFAGLTYPSDINQIATNYTNIKDVTYDYAHDVAGLNKAIQDKAFIVALFDIDKLTTGTPNTDTLQRTFGNHYIQILSITLSGDDIELYYWNWGSTNPIKYHVKCSWSNYQSAIKNYTILQSDEK